MAVSAALLAAAAVPSRASADAVFTSITIDSEALRAAAGELYRVEELSLAVLVPPKTGIEPGTLALLAAALGGIGILRRRRDSNRGLSR